MNHWTEYCGYLHTGDCSIDIRDDTPSSRSSSSSSSTLAAAAAVTSSCINNVTSRSSSVARTGTTVHSGGDVNRKAMSGLKKCFHCPHCRYSTDRKNNLKRHLGTMHRDHHGTSTMELDQTSYHVSLQRRVLSCQSCVEDFDFNGRSFNKRHVATVLLDDFARTADVSTALTDDVDTHPSKGGSQHLLPSVIIKSDDVNIDQSNAGSLPPLPPPSLVTARNDDVMMREITQTDDVNTRLRDAGTRPLLSTSTSQSDDVNTDKTEAVTQPSSVTTQNDDVTIRRTAQNGDVSLHHGEYDTLQPLPPSPIADCRNSLPEFEPRPETAYRRQSSRMFFYDRLRSTHDFHSTD